MDRLTREEACKFLGCGMTKLYELERSGKLKGMYYTIGRKRYYITAYLEQWLLSGGENKKGEKD